MKNANIKFLEKKLEDLKELKDIGAMGLKIGTEELNQINKEIKCVTKKLYSLNFKFKN